MLGAYSLQQAGNSHTGSTSTIYYYLGILELLSYQLEAVHQGRYYNDGSAMLIIMEYRNVHGFLQAVLNVKALRSLDILQIDAAKAWLQHLYSVANIVYAAGVEAQRHCIYTGKVLEEHSLALHNRQASTSTDIAQTKYSSTVGNNGYHVGLGCIVINLIVVFLDFQTWGSNTRCISQGQILVVSQIHLTDNFQLSLVFLMQLQSFLINIAHTYHLPHISLKSQLLWYDIY